jgi:nucleoside-diphosphate-sugar epimerase
MTTLVTGGCGFLGQTLMMLLRQREVDAVSFDRRIMETGVARGTHYVQGDLNDLPLLLETIDRYRVDRIVHTAAISHPHFSLEVPFQTVTTNAMGTTCVFEAARLKGIRRVTNFSSECAYGDNAGQGPITEDAPLNPTTPYGATKVFTEKLASVYNRLYGMKIVSLRPGWIYGPGQFMQCYLKTLLRNAIDGQPTVEKTGREYRFQHVHVTDVARAALLAIEAETTESNVFNVTGGVYRSYDEVADIVRTLFPSAKIELGPGTITVLDQYDRFDLSRAERELGYRPSVPLEQGIADYADWLRTHAF